MEHCVKLGTQNYRDSICQSLRKLREQEELPLKIYEYQFGKRWLIQCQFQVPESDSENERNITQKIHHYYLANAVAETILLYWEKDYISRVLRAKYRLKKEEAQDVLMKTIELLNREGRGYSAYRKTGLTSQILSCLESGSVFEIEGFLRFRAKDYKEEVDRAISFAVEEHVINKEYLEFVHLLKHFVDSQTPRLNTLHVVISYQGKFHLYNHEGGKVTHFLQDYIPDEGNGEFFYEDLLINSILTVAPHEIILHIRYDGYRDTLDTIRSVFGERVSYCQGCSLCEKL